MQTIVSHLWHLLSFCPSSHNYPPSFQGKGDMHVLLRAGHCKVLLFSYTDQLCISVSICIYCRRRSDVGANQEVIRISGFRVSWEEVWQDWDENRFPESLFSTLDCPSQYTGTTKIVDQNKGSIVAATSRGSIPICKLPNTPCVWTHLAFSVIYPTSSST